MKKPYTKLLGLAAIVSLPIHEHKKRIIYAARDNPLMPQDSGWQFHEKPPDNPEIADARIWTLKEVLDYEPTLMFILQLDPGVAVWRKTRNSKWVIEEIASP